MDRIISISPGCYLDLFINAGNIPSLKIKAIDHREILLHPVAMVMVPLSSSSEPHATLGSEGLGSRNCTNQDINTNNVSIIKLHREEAHEICMGEKWI